MTAIDKYKHLKDLNKDTLIGMIIGFDGAIRLFKRYKITHEGE